MNVFRDLCSPILEALARNRTFDITIPASSDSNLDSVLDEEDEGDGAPIEPGGIVRRLNDVNGCKAYAQILAVVALVVELKAGLDR
jgi:hypothetical protein